MTDMDRRKLISLDSRRRVSLAKVGRPEHTRYLVTVEDNGVIIMRPAVVLPAVSQFDGYTLDDGTPYSEAF